MKHTLQIPRWHNQIQKVIMLFMFTPGLQEVWGACGTKLGKSFGAGAGLSAKAVVSPHSLFRWVAPIYSQAKIGQKYCSKILPSGKVTETKNHVDLNKANLTLEIGAIDTTIEFRSGKFPEDLEGEAVSGYILDETAKMQQQVYDSAKTTTTITRGPLGAFSTPKGKNWFYKKCEYAKNQMEWAKKKGVPPTHIFLHAPSILSPFVTKEAVADAERSLPARLFRQFYLASFEDDGSTFIGFLDCINDMPELDLGEANQIWFDPDHKQKNVVIGVDWAKQKDWACFVALDYEAEIPEMVGYMRFQKVSYPVAVRELVLFAARFKAAGFTLHDKTGVGEALDDMMACTPLMFQGVTFTNSLKSSMVNDLMICFERSGILLPNIPSLKHELNIYEVQTSEIGTMRFSAPEGEHDDIVTALFLAYRALTEYSGRMDIRYLDDLPKTKLGVDKYYEDLLEECGEDAAHLFGIKPRG